MFDYGLSEKDFIKLTMDSITFNETSNNSKLIYRFTDPDGVSGRSGYSFGRSQFDMSHYDKNKAKRMLIQMGFNDSQISRLMKNNSNIEDCQNRMQLPEVKEWIDKFDYIHMEKAIEYVKRLPGLPEFSSFMCLTMLVDIHNQFHIDAYGKTHTWLQFSKEYGRVIDPVDILLFKLRNYKWCKSDHGREDTMRRFQNIIDFYKQGVKNGC